MLSYFFYRSSSVLIILVHHSATPGSQNICPSVTTVSSVNNLRLELGHAIFGSLKSQIHLNARVLVGVTFLCQHIHLVCLLLHSCRCSLYNVVSINVLRIYFTAAFKGTFQLHWILLQHRCSAVRRA